jgi:hypothetical protein
MAGGRSSNDKPEDAPCCGDRDPPNMENSGNDNKNKSVFSGGNDNSNDDDDDNNNNNNNNNNR